MSSRRLDELQPILLPMPAPVIRSKRAAIVARAFGVKPTVAAKAFENPPMNWLDSLMPEPGKIVLITGPSGAGKSSLLRAMRNSARFTERFRWTDLEKVRLPDRSVVDCFGGKSLVKTLESLSRVGLAEVWTYLRTPDELSEGQRWRLRLAIALSRKNSARRGLIVCDEFAAVLDRVTAAVVARTLRRAIDAGSNTAAVLATSHEDLAAALCPDFIITCDFGQTTITHR